MNIHLHGAQIKKIAKQIRSEEPEDEQLLLDCLEGETELFEIVRNLLSALETGEADEVALKNQIEQRRGRLEAARGRQVKIRSLILALMEAAGLDRINLAEATFTRRMSQTGLAICNEAAVPDEFTIISRKIDKRKVNEAFQNCPLPNWLVRESATPILTVRRK